jgi:MerR family transcriptional regulator, copper efflux regulator
MLRALGRRAASLIAIGAIAIQDHFAICVTHRRSAAGAAQALRLNIAPTAMGLIQINERREGLTLQLASRFRLHKRTCDAGHGMEGVTIGKLAKTVGIGAGTLRYYEYLGLLAPAQRTTAGYRMYGDGAARRLRFIRRAQALGFSLTEIAELLALSDNPRAGAHDVKKATRSKIADIEARIEALRRMKRGLEALESRCSGHGSTRDCPILAALNRDDH